MADALNFKWKVVLLEVDLDPIHTTCFSSQTLLVYVKGSE